mmetsp:Transcript_18097/g.25501  ORF Transcript_18097/g.25501 Transcript_18097/m.25501 type:complete len:700 (+) Transcript_18097:322-2421(+)
MSITKNEEGRDSVSSSRTSSMQRITSETSTTSRMETVSPQSPAATGKLIRGLSFQDGNRSVMESRYMGFLAVFVAIRVAMSTSKNSNSEDFSPIDLLPGGNLSFNTRTWVLIYFSAYLLILHRGRAHRSLSSILAQFYTKCKELISQNNGSTESADGRQLKSSRTSTESLAQRMKRISSQQRWGSFQATFKFEQGGADGHVSVLSAAEPFVPTDITSEMTLADMTLVFRYAFNLSKDELNLTDHRNLSKTLKRVLRNMDSAAGMSRGVDVEPVRPSLTSSTADYGDVDALRFCAALRLFAEWRIIRQVPDGYKGYAVGMSIGKRDTIQNVAKIEHAVHSYINYMKRNNESSSPVVTSPTLRQLLQHEIDMKVHKRLPKLKESSAAMGVIWILRQLQYNTLINANLLEIPHTYPSSKEAVEMAYKKTFDKYHGWALKKIFSYSFQAAPNQNIIYEHMNQHRLQEYVEAFQKHSMATTKEEEDQKEDTKISSKEEEIKPLGVQENDFEGQIERDLASLSSQYTEESWLLIEDDDESSSNDSIPAVGGISFLSEMSFEIEPRVCENFEKKKNPLEEFGEHMKREMDKFGKHVESEWNKFAGGIVKILDKNHKSKEKKISQFKMSRSSLHKLKELKEADNNKEVNTASVETFFPDEMSEEFISKQMVKDARQQIMMHLEVANPLLDDLTKLVNELNMNDPTRV